MKIIGKFGNFIFTGGVESDHQNEINSEIIWAGHGSIHL